MPTPPADAVALEAGTPFAILRLSSDDDIQVGYELEPRGAASFLSVQHYRVDGSTLRWRIGSTDVAGGSSDFTLDAGEYVVLATATTAQETTLRVQVDELGTVRIETLSTGQAQVAYHEVRGGEVHTSGAEVADQNLTVPPGAGARFLSVASDHDGAVRSWTHSAFAAVQLAGAGRSTLTWEPFGASFTETRPVVGPALAMVKVNTETGDGSARMHAQVEGASALGILLYAHSTVPVDPAALGYDVEPLRSVGLVVPRTVADSRASAWLLSLEG